MDQECQQEKCELVTISCKLSEKGKKGKWYLRNAATFKDIRAGEFGLELFKVTPITQFDSFGSCLSRQGLAVETNEIKLNYPAKIVANISAGRVT